MTVTKSALTITSLATAMLFGGGIYLFLNLGSIAQNLAEDYATRSLGVNVTIGRMDVSLQERRIDVSNLKIHNPEGYAGAHAATVKSIHIQAGALGKELLEFKDVRVEGADIYLEITPDSTNLTDIRKNLNDNAGAKPAQGEEALKVILDKLFMSGVIHPDVTFLDRELEPFMLPSIEMSDIGRGENGVPVGDAIAEIWKRVSRESIRAANQKGVLAGVDVSVLQEAGMADIQIIKDNIDHQVDKITNDLKSMFE